MNALAGLAARWRVTADQLERHGSRVPALTLRDCARELEREIKVGEEFRAIWDDAVTAARSRFGR